MRLATVDVEGSAEYPAAERLIDTKSAQAHFDPVRRAGRRNAAALGPRF